MLKIKNNIKSHQRKNEKLYVLIDHTLEVYRNDQIWNILEAKEFTILKSNHPGLINSIDLRLYEVIDDDFLGTTIKCALYELEPKLLKNKNGRIVCAWITSSNPIASIAQELSKYLVQKLKEQEILFRYFDPSVMSILNVRMDDWQKNRLFSNVSHWMFLDLNTDLININGNDLIENKQLHSNLSLSKHEVEYIEYINQLVNEYRLLHNDDSVPKIIDQALIEYLYETFDFYYSHFNEREMLLDFSMDIMSNKITLDDCRKILNRNDFMKKIDYEYFKKVHLKNFK